jgi:histidyl-tRNA synthetase
VVLEFLWVDRIYLVVEELNLFRKVTESSKALFINYGDTEAFYAYRQYKLRSSV